MNPGRDDDLGSTGSDVAPLGARAVGGYELLEELGRGCMGVVYRARRLRDGQVFALKIVLDESPSQEALGRFAREAQVGIRLRHPGIVPVVDVGQAQGRMYLVMEFCPGPTLEDRLRERGALPARDAAELAAELADALSAAHAQGVLHRDLKPANVILDQRAGGRPRITDFGLARDQRDDRDLTRSGQAVGTPSHMAPEQIRGLQIDARAEVWALGVLLYECLSGELPFPAETYTEVGNQILYEEPPAPGGELPALSAYVLGMLAKDADRRPASMTAVARRLRELADPAANLAQGPPGGRAALLAGLGAGASALALTLVGGGLLLGAPWRGAAPAVVASVDGSATPAPATPRAEDLIARAEGLARDGELAEVVLPLFNEVEPLVAGEPELERRVLLGRLFLLFRRGRYEEALEQAEALVQRPDPALFAPAGRVKGWALIRLNRTPEGLSAWRQLAERAPESLEGIAAESRLAFFQGQNARGAELNRRALELDDPQRPQGFLRVTAAYAALQEGNPEAALTWLDEAERLLPDAPRVHLVRAFVLQRTQDWRRARHSVEAALELTAPRGFVQGLETLAAIATQQGDTPGALEAYSRLVDDFSHGAALFRRGELRWRLGQAGEARGDFERLRAEFPQVWGQVQASASARSLAERVLGR
ncbi:MAG: serine/threonine-protein kinase [Planctomycetota bacterium]